MYVRKDTALYDNFNNVRLELSNYGYADGNDWHGERNPPLVSRLLYIMSGDPYIIVKKQRINLEPGKCYFIPYGCSFVYGCESYLEYVYFFVRFNGTNGNDLMRTCDRVMEYTPAPGVMERLKGYVTSKRVHDALLLRGELYSAIIELFECNSFELSQAIYSPVVVQARDYVRAHTTVQISIEELAAQLFVSVSTLTKKFKAEVGVPLGTYIENCALDGSVRLLVNSDMSVRQISEFFEFSSQSYFTRRFKLKYGMTPNQYRRQNW